MKLITPFLIALVLLNTSVEILTAQKPAEKHPDLTFAYATAPMPSAANLAALQDPNLPTDQQHDIVTFKGDKIIWEVWSVASKEAATALDHRVVVNDTEYKVNDVNCREMFLSENGGKPYLCDINLPTELMVGTNVVIGRTYKTDGTILSESYPPLVIIKDSGGVAQVEQPPSATTACKPGTYKVQRFTRASTSSDPSKADVLENAVNALPANRIFLQALATASAMYHYTCEQP